jgi:tetratricopeptide (TPR) repeat protein
MKKLFILIITLLNFVSLFAGDTKELFDKANKYYQKGDYKKAADQYNSILKEGYESAEVYYNLGNCYYKLDSIPTAILNYERAKRLNPEDEDIDFNLKLANLRTVDKIEPLPPVFLKNWWADLASLYSSNLWGLATAAAVLAASLFGILFFVAGSVALKKLLFTLATIFIIGAIFLFALGNTRNKIEKQHNTAIIIKPSVYVKSSPNEKSADLFILHEGTKVSKLDELGKWEKIRTASGNEGWITSDFIEVI